MSQSRQEITVLTPGTVANMVCGFDVMGFALESPCDRITLRCTPGNGSITIENLDEFNLPTDPSKNVMGVALAAFQLAIETKYNWTIISEKRIKPGSGIGSSAASAAGVVVAANQLLKQPFNNAQLLPFAMEGEYIASGSRHADNIAPCIYGGITLIRSNNPVDVVPLAGPSLFVTVLHPQIEVRTADSRAVLKKHVLLKDAIVQWGNVAGLVAGLLQSDYDLISRSLQDVLIEPVRSMLIPAFYEVKQAALSAGALGGGISGSGPSIFMLSRDMDTATRVEAAMSKVYSLTGLVFHTHVTTINSKGVRVQTA